MGGWFGDEGVGFGSATFAEMRDRGLARKQPISIAPNPTLTPSEVALSKVLAAWVEWWVAAPSCGPDGDCMSDVGLSLIKRGMVNRNGTTSPAGAALLDRARKAGVL